MHFKMSSAICFSLNQSKILSYGNGLKKKNGHMDILTGTKYIMQNDARALTRRLVSVPKIECFHLTLSQATNLRLFQTERVYRRQFQF